ncbi:ribonuclease H-like protein [Trametes coccinea BRFM310]|uniref:Ribonuclease H-like protein n=1 Tax=Trametes coccinea (strain BRFM310) TaxID=1353009 RepID=A0A1Y2IXF9_TRAC3|nr:ribonuclease H-like protein [Trametes coccinea BRFM310]
MSSTLGSPSSAAVESSESQSSPEIQPQQPARVYNIYSWKAKSPGTRLVYIQNAAAADQAISQLNSKILGFDLEWKPNFVKGRAENPVALVQLASEHLILLIHVSYMPAFPEKLRELLADETILKAGVGIQKDCKKLYHDHGVDTRNCVDLSLLARTVDNARWKGKYSSPIGLARLCETYEELTLQKGRVQTSNWEQALDLRQQEYAANDCHVGLTLYTRLAAMAAAMSPVPDRAWYSFDTISGFLYEPSSGELWQPHNPYYDPGPPPPPRPAKVFNGDGQKGSHDQFRGARFPRRGRARHERTGPLSPSASAFVPGASAHSPSPSPSPVAGFSAQRPAPVSSTTHSASYTRNVAPRYPSPGDTRTASPVLQVDDDGFPRAGRPSRGFQNKPPTRGGRGGGFGAHQQARIDLPHGRGRGRGRGRGQGHPTVHTDYFVVAD